MGYVLFFLGIFLAISCIVFYKEAREHDWFGYDMFDTELTICCLIAAIFFLYLGWDGLNMIATMA